jgi:hypothetical protein
MRKRLDVRLPEALHASLFATAAAQDRTVTWVVERALEAALGGSTAAGTAGAEKRAPASPRMPVGKLIDTATGAETPVVLGATVSSCDLVDYAFGRDRPRCESCERRGPPKSFPCKTCGHQRASK